MQRIFSRDEWRELGRKVDGMELSEEQEIAYLALLIADERAEQGVCLRIASTPAGDLLARPCATSADQGGVL